MLLSFPKEFLFVHIAKTGGSSVRSVLAGNRWRHPYFWAQMVCHRLSSLTGHRLASKLPRHAPIVAAMEMLSRESFEQLFKFAFVRNPWDRMVSAYCHFERERTDLLSENGVKSFDDFVQWMIHDAGDYRGRGATFVQAIRRPQREYLIDLHGNLAVDMIGRYELLAKDYASIARRLGFSARLPHKRRSNRDFDYRTHYSQKSIEWVGNYYSTDIKQFDYQFESQDVVSIPFRGQSDDEPLSPKVDYANAN